MATAVMKTSPLKSSGSPSHGRVAGNYTDPNSPVASSPQNSFTLPKSLQMPFGNEETSSDILNSSTESWTSSLLSPVLKLFGTDVSLDSQESFADTTVELKMEEDETKSRTESEDMDEEMSYEFDPFFFMAQLPPHHLVRHNLQDPTRLPMSMDPSKPTLVLDLDETLVHCSPEPTESYDVTFGVQFNGSVCQVFVKKRPYLDEFLEHVSKKFEVVIFTASQRVYAERLLDILDPHGKYIHHRLYRESCLMVSGNLLKDLTIINRQLSRTMIVDNSPHAFGYQLDNGIPIVSWYDNPHDIELKQLVRVLDHLHPVEDVRPLLRELYGVRNLVEDAKIRFVEWGY